MKTQLDWSEWILEKNSKATVESLSKSNFINLNKSAASSFPVHGTPLHFNYVKNHGDNMHEYQITHDEEPVGMIIHDGNNVTNGSLDESLVDHVPKIKEAIETHHKTSNRNTK